jgi:hypothetical protein
VHLPVQDLARARQCGLRAPKFFSFGEFLNECTNGFIDILIKKEKTERTAQKQNG